MARTKGMLNLSGNLEVNAQAPLDARTIVPTEADLTVASNFPYPYIGLEVYVTGTGKKFRLVNLDTTQSSSWHEVGEGGGGSGLPSGGTAGQYLVKQSATEGDADWQSLSAFTGATSEAAGAAGLVPAPASGDEGKVLFGNGTWGNIAMPSVDYSQQSVEANIFDTIEKVIGQWTDGKLLYQKVITGNTNADSSAVKVLETLSNLDTAFIPCAYVVSNSQVNGIGKSWGNIDSKKSIGDLYVNTSDGKVTFYTINQNFFNKPIVVVLRYTKTTDSPLSADEKFAGVDVDGSVIYKKTYTTNTEWTIYANSFTDTDISATNVEKCIDCKGYDNNGSSITGFFVNTYGKGSRYTSFNVCGYRANNAAVGITRFDFYYTKKTS